MKTITPKRPRKSHSSNHSQTFSFGLGRPYANNDEYAEKGVLFDILAIEFEPGKGFEGRDRWALTVEPKDRDPEIMTFGSNPKRDEQLRSAEAHLKRGGAIKNKRLRRSGNAYYLTDGIS